MAGNTEFGVAPGMTEEGAAAYAQGLKVWALESVPLGWTCLCHSAAVQLWANEMTSLYLRVLSYKMGTGLVSCQDSAWHDRSAQ